MKTTSTMPDSEAHGPSARAETRRAASRASREFQDFLADVEDLIASSASLTGEELARAKARLNERIAAARESAEAIGEKVTDRVRSTAKSTDSYVHEHPWQAAGVAAALGLLLGLALSRRS